ncbi:transglycosylase family protein [Streptomyces sp. GC420]|uniref:LysM peptidoglycan-binding domain-containing protein n=1 Tax=Streptomyces sp. GC420 TaxID=2697568 RepID=UPI001414D5A1|nr:transglycosylase family protein [Streptomyces sp. GC420]NBM17967.1 peptigoglycan-binding protein LysM [Streptomyces sp. GC420]
MLSGNGRHRRPRQAPALVVAAGVTGSAIAIPLLGAGAASAADGATWDKVAQCESDGVWSADTGNGFYGGLQLTQEMWEQYGGLDYAPRPDLASRTSQIAVAEKVLAAEGAEAAWPSCGTVAGLGQAAGSSGAGSGLPNSGRSGADGAAESSDGGSGSGSDGSDANGSGSGGAGDADAGEDSADADASDGQESGDGAGQKDASGESGKSDEVPEDGASRGTGKHRGNSASEDDVAANADNSLEATGRHASRGDAYFVRVTSGEGSAPAAEGEYEVRGGDTLVTIADAHGLDGGWTALYEENEQVVGADPDVLLPGLVLELGAEESEK